MRAVAVDAGRSSHFVVPSLFGDQRRPSPQPQPAGTTYSAGSNKEPRSISRRTPRIRPDRSSKRSRKPAGSRTRNKGREISLPHRSHGNLRNLLCHPLALEQRLSRVPRLGTTTQLCPTFPAELTLQNHLHTKAAENC